MVSHSYAENPKVSRHAKRSHIGIDLWHAVEFSRYGCALVPKFPPFSGQTDKLSGVHAEGQFREVTLDLKSFAARPLR